MSSDPTRSDPGTEEDSESQYEGGVLGRFEQSMEPIPEEERTVPDPLLALFAAVPIALIAELTAREQWEIVASVPSIGSVAAAIVLSTAVYWWLSLATGEGARWGRRFALASGACQGGVILVILVLRLVVGDAAFSLDVYESTIMTWIALFGGLFAVFAAVFSMGAGLTWLVAER